MTDLDPTTAVTAAILSKDVVVKLLGPSAEYVGQRARGLLEKCDVNLNDIWRAAVRRLGRRLEEPGGVSPRILKHVVVEGSFCDDRLAQEYFGGLLASSRVPNADDDRALGYLDALESLPSDQLRLHYVFYTSFARLFRGQIVRTEYPLRQPSTWDYVPRYVFLPVEMLAPLLDLPQGLEQQLAALKRSVNGLKRVGLISSNEAVGGADVMRSFAQPANAPGAILGPAPFGAELFLWANGLRMSADDIGSPDLVLQDLGFRVSEGAADCAGLDLGGFRWPPGSR